MLSHLYRKPPGAPAQGPRQPPRGESQRELTVTAALRLANASHRPGNVSQAAAFDFKF